ncbi:MAG TPA: LysM peptidoglycan-binding domain-containing protein [Verrucomicrobiae bacterium]|nr:LysM peptidoglycan-binding domain-containing protein [Verrucomicrobiae bacterium]
MTRFVWWIRVICVALICLGANGCSPSGQSQLDEQKEPHYLAGKSRESAMDYQGAIKEFEESLEVNPHSAAAHLELGLLYERNDTDCAAAIYHFEQYLKLRPNAGNADVIKQHILACKQELARTVSLGLVTQNLQHEFEQLAAENQRLRDEVQKWRAYYARQAAMTNPAASPVSANRVTPTPTVVSSAPGQPTPGVANRPGNLTPTSTRTHKVQAGETMAAIARQCGIPLDALRRANAGVNPRRLQVGQLLNIPPR